MARIERIDVADQVYHVLNRANARVQIFDTKEDYKQFEDIIEEAVERFDMRLLGYCIMPNHWHLVLYPEKDGDLKLFMSWLTNTHTRRWHVTKETVGQGHLYQGRYKSFLCATDSHFYTLMRYVERNAKTAKLVKKAQDWQWSSIWRREYGSSGQKKILSDWPISKPEEYLLYLNQALTQKEEELLERSVSKSIPFGKEDWVQSIVKKFKIEQVLRGVGRPKNGG